LIFLLIPKWYKTTKFYKNDKDFLALKITETGNNRNYGTDENYRNCRVTKTCQMNCGFSMGRQKNKANSWSKTIRPFLRLY